MRRIACRAGLALVVLTAVAVPADALAGAHAAATHTVVIKNYAYTPAKLSIKKGDSVRWLFDDGSTPHNVTSSRFRSSPTLSHGSFTVRFNKKGTFSYTCTLHTWMNGSITVH